MICVCFQHQWNGDKHVQNGEETDALTAERRCHSLCVQEERAGTECVCLRVCLHVSSVFRSVSSPLFWFADIAYVYQTIRPQESASEDIEGKPSSCLTFIISKRKVAFLRPIR